MCGTLGRQPEPRGPSHLLSRPATCSPVPHHMALWAHPSVCSLAQHTSVIFGGQAGSVIGTGNNREHGRFSMLAEFIQGWGEEWTGNRQMKHLGLMSDGRGERLLMAFHPNGRRLLSRGHLGREQPVQRP